MKRLLALAAILSLALVACGGDPISDTVVPGAVETETETEVLNPADLDREVDDAADEVEASLEAEADSIEEQADQKEDELEDKADEVEASLRAEVGD